MVGVSTRSTNAALNGNRGVSPPLGASVRSRRQQRSMVLAGLLVMLVTGVAVAMLVTRSGGKVSAVVAARAVPIGHQIERADLTTMMINPGDLVTYAGKHADSLVGKIALVGLTRGQLLNPDMVGDGPEATPGAMQVGVLVKPGQLPAEGLSAGDTVMVVQVPDAGPGSPSDTAPTVLLASTTVLGSRASDTAGTTVVTVQAPADQAAELAAASSAGDVALVKVTK